jgi:hypothetical protein
MRNQIGTRHENATKQAIARPLKHGSALESLQALPWLYLPGERFLAPYSYCGPIIDRDGQSAIMPEAF